MGQFSKVLLAIDIAHTVSQRALDCGPGLGEIHTFSSLGFKWSKALIFVTFWQF